MMTSIHIAAEDLREARGKVVVITGGVGGIGKATSELFHSLGAKVVIGDLDQKAGDEFITVLGTARALFQVCDVTQWESLHLLFETAVKQFGRVDITIANAGVPEIEDIFDERAGEDGKLMEPQYIVLDINLKAILSSEYFSS